MLRNRRNNVADLTRLAIQAIIGKEVTEANYLPQLVLTLHNRMAVDDQSELLQLLDDYLYREDRTDPKPLTEAIELVSMSLEMYEPENRKNTDPNLAAAYFLHKHGLWTYVRKDRNGQKRLSVLLIGASPMRKAFLDTIIPCAQMLDTEMHIRIIAEDAATFCDQYLKKAPLLAQAVRMTHIPARPNRTYTLNEAITGKDHQGNIAPLLT